MNNTEQAMGALMALAGASFRIERTAPDTARVEVLSVKSKRGQILMPLTYSLEVEILVQLNEATRTYSFSGRSFETNGFGMSSETFRGIYRLKQWGRHLTLDGVVPVKFDTGIIFDQIEQTLIPLGWSRG